MAEIKTLNDLNLKISSNEKTLVEESCCTAITIALNNDGEVFTSFVGAYNPHIIKLLKTVQKTYYKNLMKKLKEKNLEEYKQELNKTEEPVEVQEKPKKEKKVHEARKKDDKKKND